MNLNYLDFEQPIAELQKKIDELRFVANGSEINIVDQIQQLGIVPSDDELAARTPKRG